MIPWIFVVLGLVLLATGSYWWALLALFCAISVRFTALVLFAMIMVILLFGMVGCSGFGPQMSDLNYSNGQSFSTTPCLFYLNNTCLSVR